MGGINKPKERNNKIKRRKFKFEIEQREDRSGQNVKV
jgi:hypothetical protein